MRTSTFTVVAIAVMFLLVCSYGCCCQGQTTPEKAPAAPDKAKVEGNPVVVMETSLGTVRIELFADKAPISVKNFLAYVDAKFYDGTIFHRVIANFMVQGGGMTADLKQKKTNDPIKNEADNGLSNQRGTIAMARTNVVDSATSQFFINVEDNKKKGLDHTAGSFGYAVFGKVIEGMDVVDKIRNVKTNPGDVPAETVLIKSIRRAEGK